MAAWSGWTPIPGGKTRSGPSAQGAVTVAVRGTDDTVYTSRFVSGHSWGPWTAAPGLSTNTGAAVGTLYGREVLVARDGGGRIHHCFAQGDGWGPWSELPGGGLTPSAPAVTDNAIVVRGTGDDIHFNAVRQDGTWTGWRVVRGGGRTHDAPAVATVGAVRVILVRGTNDRVYYQMIFSDLSTDEGWKEVPGGGLTPSAPAMCGSLVLVRGTNDLLYSNGFDGGSTWEGWKEVPGGGRTVDAPALAHAPGYFTAVIRGIDDGVHHSFYS